MVDAAGATGPETEVEAARALEPSPPATLPEDHRVVEFERRADSARMRSLSTRPNPTAAVPARWLNARVLVAQLVASLGKRWSVAALFGIEQARDDELARGDVLDGEADRFEYRHHVGIPTAGPLVVDAPDLDEVLFRH